MLRNCFAFAHTILISINFLLILFFIWKSRRVLSKTLQEIKWPYYVGLVGVIIILAILYSFLISPKHYIYTDEFIYEQAAINVLTQGHFGTLMKSQGWSFLISLGYLFGGIKNYTSIYLAEILGGAAVLCFFFLAIQTGASQYGAFISTLIFAFLPTRIFWAATGESHTAALFCVVLAMAFSFLFYRKYERSLFWLSLITWSFAIQVRGENIFLLGLFFIGIWLFLPVDLRPKIPWADGLFICTCLVIPQLILGLKHVFVSSAQYGQIVTLSNIFHNLKYVPQFLLGEAHPFILSVIAGAGMVILWFRDRRVLLFLSLWSLLLFTFYFSMLLDIYGFGETRLFHKTRIFIFFYPPLILFVSFFMGAIRLPLIGKAAVLGAVCAGIILWSIPYYNSYLLNHDHMEMQMKIIDYAEHSVSQEDIVVTCNPEVLTTATSVTAVSADDFLNDQMLRHNLFIHTKERGGKILFLETLGLIITPCQNTWEIIKKRSHAIPVKTFSKRDSQFSIYLLLPF